MYESLTSQVTTCKYAQMSLHTDMSTKAINIPSIYQRIACYAKTARGETHQCTHIEPAGTLMAILLFAELHILPPIHRAVKCYCMCPSVAWPQCRCRARGVCVCYSDPLTAAFRLSKNDIMDLWICKVKLSYQDM